MGGIGALGRTVRHLQRYREVAAVLAKHGLGDLLHMLKVDRYVEAGLSGLLRRRGVFDAAARPERVRMALEELGPTFVKAGQYLSTRADLLPPEYLAQLARLQDRVPPFPAADARAIVERELGAPVDALFARFDGRPLAAASIAQAHAAVLPGGEPVVVKVERPGLRELVAVDLDIMAHLAALAEKHSEEWAWRRPAAVVAEVARSLDRELDLSLEAAHLERFARQAGEDPTVRAPRVHRALSTSRVLTLERLEGVKASDAAALEQAGLDPRVAAERLAQHYLAMIFVHGFFHADPHPGNLLVQDGHVIAYLDFGMMGRLDAATRESLAEAVRAVVERDADGLCRALLGLADYEQEPDRRAFSDDVAELMDQYAYRPLAEWRLGRMLEQLFRVTGRHRVNVPPELFLMVKTLSELENLVRALDPGLDVVSAAEPFIRHALAQRASPARLRGALERASREALGLLSSAPADLREILRQARRGRLLIEFEHKGLEPALASLDRVSNRLAYAVLLAALLIGSSLLVLAGQPPLWRGMPVLGLGGFVLSALMAAALLAAIARHGRL